MLILTEILLPAAVTAFNTIFNEEELKTKHEEEDTPDVEQIELPKLNDNYSGKIIIKNESIINSFIVIIQIV